MNNYKLPGGSKVIPIDVLIYQPLLKACSKVNHTVSLIHNCMDDDLLL